jgi:hypothetical protein
VARGLPSELVGNRLALVGATIYLVEWVVIVFLADVPTDDFGTDATAIVDAYTGESDATSARCQSRSAGSCSGRGCSRRL